jgi:hypothetical protein
MAWAGPRAAIITTHLEGVFSIRPQGSKLSRDPAELRGRRAAIVAKNIKTLSWKWKSQRLIQRKPREPN